MKPLTNNFVCVTLCKNSELDQFNKIAISGFDTKLILSKIAIKRESQFHLKVNLAIFQVDPKPAAPINKVC